VRDCKGKWLAAEIVKTRCAAAVASSAFSLPGADLSGDGGVEYVLVHYIGWSNRWDEWLELSSDNRNEGDGKRSGSGGFAKDDERIAPLGLFTTTAAAAGSDMGNQPPPFVYALGDQVLVYYNAPLPRAWARGVITQIDGLQCSVRYEPTAATTATAAAASSTKGSSSAAGGAFQRWFHARSDEIEIDRAAQPADARA
jgi:hypothetical protein